MPHQKQKLLRTEYPALLTSLSELPDSEYKKTFRELCRGDLWFLLRYVLKRSDLEDVHNPDWLFERVREVEEDPDGHIDLWAREHYKALALNTPVWTPDGWVAHGDLRPGDKVYAPNGEIKFVIANTGPMIGSDCYKVGSITAAGDHLWPVQVKHRKRVAGSDARSVSYTTEIMHTRDMREAALRDIEPLSGYPSVAERELPIPPYTLGLWLGDGNTRDARITNADDVWSLCDWRGEIREQASPITRNFIGLFRPLRLSGLLGNKHVPMDYLQAHPKQRLAILQGLMDSDGHVNARGTATFVNTNPVLSEGVRVLAASLGMRPHKRVYAGYEQVSFQAYKGEWCPFRLQRKIDRCKSGKKTMRRYTPEPCESVPVNCIQVEDGEYIAGLEMLPTHNSTIITYAKTIQDILRYYGDDRGGADYPWQEYDEPTFCILANVRPLSKAFLRQIREELEGNTELKELFPDILWTDPKKEAAQWSLDDGIVVKRNSNPKEATIEAWGLIDGQPTGKHYTFLIYDDVVTQDSVTNPDMIDKTTDAWRLSDNLSAGETTKTRIIGTRYAFADTYNVIMNETSISPRIYPCTADGTVEGDPVMRSKQFIKEKYRKQGPYIFASQMLQNPTADTSQGFKREWFRYYERPYDAKYDTFKRMNRYLLVDPANEKKQGSDYTAAAVIGLGADMNYYLLDFYRDRLNLKERADLVFYLHEHWRPKKVGYEKYGKDSDISYFNIKMKEDNYRFSIQEMGGKVSKTDRIKRLIPAMSEHRFFLPEELYRTLYDGKEFDMTKVLVEEEFLLFPVPLHDDGIDCIARIFDIGAVWPKSNVRQMQSQDRWARAAAKRPTGSFMSA